MSGLANKHRSSSSFDTTSIKKKLDSVKINGELDINVLIAKVNRIKIAFILAKVAVSPANVAFTLAVGLSQYYEQKRILML